MRLAVYAYVHVCRDLTLILQCPHCAGSASSKNIEDATERFARNDISTSLAGRLLHQAQNIEIES